MIKLSIFLILAITTTSFAGTCEIAKRVDLSHRKIIRTAVTEPQVEENVSLRDCLKLAEDSVGTRINYSWNRGMLRINESQVPVTSASYLFTYDNGREVKGRFNND